MTASRPLISNFTGGELTDLLLGRSDLEFYRNGCRDQVNMISLPQGPATRRPGTRDVAAALYADRPSRLIAFRFSRAQNYVTEWSNGAVRFFRDRAQLVAAPAGGAIANGSFAAGITGWTDASTGDAAIEWTESAQQLGLIGAASGGVAAARTSVAFTTAGTKVLALSLFGMSGAPWAIRVGTTAGGQEILTDWGRTPGRHLIAFGLASPATVYIEIRHEGARSLYLDDVRLLSDEPLQLASPYSDSDVFDLQYQHSKDFLWLVGAGQPWRKLLRYGDQSWSLVEVENRDGPWLDQNTTETTLSADGNSGIVTITASSKGGINDGRGFVAGDVGRLVKLFEGWARITAVTSPTTVTAEVGEAANGSATLRPTLTADTLSVKDGDPGGSGALHNDIIRDSAAGFLEAGFEDGMTVTVDGFSTNPDLTINIERVTRDTLYVNTTVDLGDEAAGATVTVTGLLEPTKVWSLGAWSDTTGHPVAISTYLERLVLADDLRLVASVNGDFERFTVGTEDDLSISRVIASEQQNGVAWLLEDERGCLIGAADVERIFLPGSSAQPLSPANNRIAPGTAYGSARDRPVRVNDGTVLLLQSDGLQVREVNFSIARDGYEAPDLLLRAEHLTRPSPIVGLAWAKAPWPILWAWRADGLLLACTYQSDAQAQVRSWSRCPLGGAGAAVESGCAIPGTSNAAGHGDELWLCVRRTIGGVPARRIEVLWWPTGEVAQADHFHVDGGTTRTPVAGEVTGLSWLEGAEVDLWADGARLPRQTVTGGTITVDAAKVQVGHPMEWRLRPMPIEGGSVLGTSQGVPQRIVTLGIRLLRSSGVKVGWTLERLEAIPDGPAGLGEAPPLFDGMYHLTFPGDRNTEGQLWITGDGAGPVTVCTLVPRLNTGDR